VSPSWYDLLGIDEDASADEVRVAWRDAVADLDPTDRRFGVLNEAAAVLLDPSRRAAYDAQRGEAAGAPASSSPATPAEAPPPSATAGPATPTATAATDGRRVPAWLLALLAACVAVLAASAVWVAVTVPTDEEVGEATRQAQAAAERAIVPVLSYDFRDLERSREDAVDHLTDDFREDYEALFSQIEENASSTRTVVETEVLASAIVRGGTERAEVLLFIDQPTTNAATTEPVTYRNQVTVRLERVGGRWLVDDLVTTPAA
jgi:Mce-associated membrane protein